MRRILYLLVLMGATWAQEDYTLLDIIPAHSTVRLFDTLSASVASEYEGRPISFDASQAPVFEDRPINLNQLNEKYRDYLYQGDMLISPERLEQVVQSSVDNGKRKRRQAYRANDYPSSIWGGGIPYTFHRSISAQARYSINRAINFWHDSTCIEFRHRTNEKQYLEFIGNDDGCWSTVGKDNSLGRQVVSIGKGCEHIPRNLLSIYQLPYDVGSVMHYTPTEFSERRGIPALTTVDPNLQQTMGQMEGPSFLDVAIINAHYNCAARCPRRLACQNGGIVNSRKCNECICPSGFGGQLCQAVAPSFSKGCGGVINVGEAVRRFDISIRQVGEAKEKQCIYHLRAPPGKRILINVIRVGGRCIEGCWQDGAEFKMKADYRAVGYRDYLYQGDMLISPERLEQVVQSSVDNGKRKRRQAYRANDYPSSIWGGGIPYTFHRSISAQARYSINRAINFWHDSTCIEFRHRTNEKQYLEFIGNDDGCWSTVGKDNSLGRQVVSIGKGCEHFGVTSHELAHALGVFHEQSRWDRDGHVQLNTKVVSPGMLFNFAKIPRNLLSIYQLPYDVGSVMHYTPTEFSERRGIPALTTVDPNLQQTMGQMEGPSFLDVAIINAHYNCAARCPRRLACQNGGIVNSRKCNECICPSGFGGQLCQAVAPSFSKGCGGVINVGEAVRRFDISIRQVGEAKEKQCIYHLRAPPGKRILINVIRVGGRCIEGCWQDGAEFKMKADYRAVGYRICCQVPRQRRILSRAHMVPFMVTSRHKEMSLAFEYTYVDANVRFDDDEASIPSEIPREEDVITTSPETPQISKNLDLMPEFSTKDADVETSIHQKR